MSKEDQELAEEELLEEEIGGNIKRWDVDEVSVVNYPANNKPFSLIKGINKKDLKTLQENGIDTTEIEQSLTKQQDENENGFFSKLMKKVEDLIEEKVKTIFSNNTEEKPVSKESTQKMNPYSEGEEMDMVSEEIKAYVAAACEEVMAYVNEKMDGKMPGDEPEMEKEAEVDTPAPATPEPVEASAFSEIAASLAALAESQKSLAKQVNKMAGARPDGNALEGHTDRPEEPAPFVPSFYSGIRAKAQLHYGQEG